MRKTKIEQRIENAVNAFFDNEKLNENKLGFLENQNLSKGEEAASSFGGKADTFIKVLKQVFLFFPGTFVIFNLIFIITVTNLNPPEFTFIILTGKAIMYLLVGLFMTILGLGDIKNIRHLIIPLSIAFFAFLSGAVISLLTSDLKSLDVYAMYLLPLALIIPILAKGWIDKATEQ